ncbi:MAG: Outer membrane protein assembly factor BamB [Candidatus Methanophagaceae archaeon]|nr:MAG: Outer membrane protein assembly factor BamB [Methanophagales archaeon]
MKQQKSFWGRIKFAPAIIIGAMLVISMTPMFAVAASSWDQFQKDEQNSGWTTDLAPQNATKAWKVYTHTDGWKMSGVDVAPIAVDGKVFVIDARSYVWAFDAKSGDIEWVKLLSCGGWEFQLATPAYGEGKLFFATNDGHVYALNPESGHTRWSKKIAETYDQLNTPVTYADGKVYVGTYKSDNGDNSTGVYYCLNATTGKVVWTRTSDTGKGYYWTGACVIGDYLVYGDRASVVTSVYKNNGTAIDAINITTSAKIPFNKSNAGGIRSSVAYSEGFCYFTSEGGYVWAIGFNESTGEFTEEGWAFAVDDEIGYAASTPAIYDGQVYMGAGKYSTGGKFYCLDQADNGTEIWNLTVNGGIKASPAISVQHGKPYIYFTTNFKNSSVYCVDDTGNEMWNYTTEEANSSAGYILQGVAIYDGYVYFGNDGGYVYGLNESGPTILWEGNVTLTENTSFNVTAHNSGNSYELNRTNALGALDAAAETGEFNYSVSDEWYASFGLFVDSIADVESTGAENWLYWVNYPNESIPEVGVTQYEVKEGDVVTYFYGDGNVTPANASKVIKIQVHTNESGPTILWEGNVTLTENTSFNVTAHNSGNSYELNRTNALGALDAAAETGKFNYSVSDEWYASFGLFVDSIADVESTGAENWLYWVNYPNESIPEVGVTQYEVKEGDVVTYFYGDGNVTPANASKVIKIRVHTGGPAIFDTGTSLNPYPSISGTHNGTITPNKTIPVNRLFTYPCAGTGGHTEFVRIWDDDVDVNATWQGYTEDWHNLTFNKPFSLEPNKTYNYTIRTGSYPQIHHIDTLATVNGEINCTRFVDGNGKEYHAMIPAIMLWKE